MGTTHFNNVAVAGILTVGGLNTAGKTFFVDKDASTSSDSNTGDAWDNAFSTIQAAVNKCVSNRHDVVLIAVATTAYAENVVVTSKDYVSIIGVARGEWGRPDLHPTAGIGLAVVLSNGFHGENLYVFSDDVDACLMEGEGWKFTNCKFQGVSDGLLLKGAASTDASAAGQGMARRCTFENNGAAGVRMEYAEAPSGVGAWGNIFEGCWFRDNTGADFLSATGATGGGAGIFLAMTISGCYFLDVAAGHVYFDMDQGNGADLAVNQVLIAGNFFADEAFVAAQCDISGQPNCMFVGNYDAAGLIDGATFND